MRAKNFLLILCVFVMLLSGCPIRKEYRAGDFCKGVYGERLGNIHIEMEENGGCTVYIVDDPIITGVVRFSSDRKALEVDHVNLIHVDDMTVFLGLTTEEIEVMLGDMYGIDDNFKGPSYITDDGYIIWLPLTEWYPQGTVCDVVKFDIYTREMLERIDSK